MVIYLAVIVLVLYLCFWFSKFIAKKMNNNTVSGNKIKIIERVALGQDKGLAICKICSRYYVIGISNQNIKILLELDAQIFNEEDKIPKETFLELMSKTLKGNKNKPQP